MPKKATFRVVLIWAVIATIALIYETITARIQQVEIQFAAEQIEVFRGTSLPEHNISLSELSERLKYVEEYYPSGTKLATGSLLDRIVEGARLEALRQIRKTISSIPK